MRFIAPITRLSHTIYPFVVTVRIKLRNGDEIMQLFFTCYIQYCIISIFIITSYRQPASFYLSLLKLLRKKKRTTTTQLVMLLRTHKNRYLIYHPDISSDPRWPPYLNFWWSKSREEREKINPEQKSRNTNQESSSTFKRLQSGPRTCAFFISKPKRLLVSPSALSPFCSKLCFSSQRSVSRSCKIAPFGLILTFYSVWNLIMWSAFASSPKVLSCKTDSCFWGNVSSSSRTATEQSSHCSY